MRKIIAWNLMTLDGYFEGEKPWELDFHTTVWGKELEELSLRQADEAAALLFGRRTYEGMAAHWSKESGAIADFMNGVKKIVASRSLKSADWNNSSVIEGDVGDAVAALRQEDGKDIFVFGSADLLSTLLPRGLVDEYRVCICPVLIGRGTPLFKPMEGGIKLDLLKSMPIEGGGFVMFYQPQNAAA